MRRALASCGTVSPVNYLNPFRWVRIPHRQSVGSLDIDKPGISSFEAARSMAIRPPNTRIIFLSAFFHDRSIEQALEVKAWG